MIRCRNMVFSSVHLSVESKSLSRLGMLVLLAILAPILFSPVANASPVSRGNPVNKNLSPLPFASTPAPISTCPPPTTYTVTCLMEVFAASPTSATPARQTTEATPQGTYPPPSSNWITPSQIREAYQLPTTTTYAPGQTIAIIDAYDNPTIEADLATYDAYFGLPACTTANGCFRKVNQRGDTTPLPPRNGKWGMEIALDVEIAQDRKSTRLNS